MDGIDKEQRHVLSVLSAMPQLKDYRLVRGTNLAIRLQHRKSVDLDLFCHKEYDHHDSKHLASKLGEQFGTAIKLEHVNEVGVFALLKGIKVDLVKDPAPFIDRSEVIDGFRLAGLKDIAAMKLSAVSGRGTKKDFYDVYALLDIFSLAEMLDYFQQKTAIEDTQHILHSLTYFSDAEEPDVPNNEVISLKGVAWSNVKTRIEEEVLKNIETELQERKRRR